MKNLFLSQLLLLCAITLNAQLIPGSKLATTTTLPEGTAIKNGKITILAGYKAFLGEKDKKVVIVQRTKRMSGTSGGSGITGTFSCRCEDGSSGDCSIQVVINEVNCAGFSCKCEMTVVISPRAGLAITRETKGETWRRVVFPVKK